MQVTEDGNAKPERNALLYMAHGFWLSLQRTVSQ
jgi:hypothetical protein